MLKQSRLEAVFLTNDFDDPLEGFDTNVYIPCLRTDDLVFHLAKPEVRAAAGAGQRHRAQRRADRCGAAIAALFQHFKVARCAGLRDFAAARFFAARRSRWRGRTRRWPRSMPTGLRRPNRTAGRSATIVFWTLAEMCDAFKLPFDLMIGVNRGVYEAGVYQGRDLYDSRVSLIQYKELFNAFPQVTFPISVLASVTNQELTSYAWIFPNVVTNGHWWYSNTPAFIEHDLAARLEAVPRTKQIGYYSDMYKLEFALPKFAMYKRILAKVLAERFVIDRGWSERAGGRAGHAGAARQRRDDLPLGRGPARRTARAKMRSSRAVAELAAWARFPPPSAGGSACSISDDPVSGRRASDPSERLRRSRPAKTSSVRSRSPEQLPKRRAGARSGSATEPPRAGGSIRRPG